MSESPPPIAWVSQQVIDSLIIEANRGLSNETGGILWGYWNETYTEVVIKNTVGPGPKALHSRYGFVPDYSFHNEVIQSLYEQSNRLETYLGDWHSHPDGGCCLSFKDKKTLHNIASYTAARAPKPIMAIIAGKESWRVKIWSYSKHPMLPFWLRWKQFKRMKVKIF